MRKGESHLKYVSVHFLKKIVSLILQVPHMWTELSMMQTGMLISCMVGSCVFDIMQVASSEVEEEEEEEEKDDGGDVEVSDQGHLKDEVCSLKGWLRYRATVVVCFMCKRDCLQP